ncbi:hypothetical protein NUW58_g6478 [Xylaria curta]|uniref:Uncharacterized protein n=1 Tax=Xylaria curta TaxID=42375 RepID=A0ACC1NTM7_9PEZI|nr:hypothetical protein NUW58_g6478 [Xylaria curta]
MSTAARRRLMRDFKRMQTDPPAGVSASPVPDNVMTWNAVIIGPADTPFEDGTFRLVMHFEEQYPNKPPAVKFISQMFHPNVYATGELCLDILQNRWSPTYDVAAVLTSIQSLLNDPNTGSPANVEASNLYKDNRKEYTKRAPSSKPAEYRPSMKPRPCLSCAALHYLQTPDHGTLRTPFTQPVVSADHTAVSIHAASSPKRDSGYWRCLRSAVSAAGLGFCYQLTLFSLHFAHPIACCACPRVHATPLSAMSSANSIKVVARFRPQNKIELESGGEPIVAFDGNDTCTITSAEAAGSFTFDRVFDMKVKQHQIFDYSIKPTVDDILNGYNGTVFAYGQTGAGKSYTMMGTSIEDDNGKAPPTIEYTVRVSYMEIYMERIRDLLAPQNDNLPVHEEKNRGVYVKGLLEIYVSSVEEVFEVMKRGGNARAVAATNMNQESSRSHSIFVITVTQKNLETGSMKSGQLFLVDLAGSEKVGKTGASGQTLEEAKKINKSLSALGMVINALTDGKSSHVPYRDSKLTRILQESLGVTTMLRR